VDLFEAIRANRVLDTRRHLDAGADANARDASGVSALEHALETALHRGDAMILGQLRAAGADPAPLIDAVDRRLRALPATSIEHQRHAVRAIDALVAAFDGHGRDLAPEDREDLAEFLGDAQRFESESAAVREACARAAEAFAHDRVAALDRAIEALMRAQRCDTGALLLAARALRLQRLLPPAA
jgi:hypothetical protein